MYLGLDLSLADTGLVIIDEKDNVIQALSIKSKRIDDTVKGRFKRYNIILDQIKNNLKDYDLKCIVIESQSFNSKGRVVQLAESAGTIKYYLANQFTNCTILEVAPQSLKKYIVGDLVSKERTKDNIIKRVKDFYNFDTDNDNIADAFVLAQIAKAYIDRKIKNNYQDEVLKGIDKKLKKLRK